MEGIIKTQINARLGFTGGLLVFLLSTPSSWAGLIHNAALKGDMEAVERQLKLGVGVNALDEYGNTALHMAVQQDNDPYMVSTLLRANANINAVRKDGNTPLHLAVLLGGLCAVEILLDANAVILVNKAGKTPLQLAIDRGYTDKIALLSIYQSR